MNRHGDGLEVVAASFAMPGVNSVGKVATRDPLKQKRCGFSPVKDSRVSLGDVVPSEAVALRAVHFHGVHGR